LKDASYRVWCLSWDDDEGHGSDVIGYDILSHDYKREERGIIYVPSVSLGSASDAAEAYADYAHDNRDGNESSWPLKFRVRCPDGQVLDFEVDRDYVTEFSASPVEPTTKAAKEHVA
jgi:hypothetical protein